MAYFGDTPFGPTHYTSEPGLAGLLSDVDLLEASTLALRGTIWRTMYRRLKRLYDDPEKQTRIR